MHEYDVLIENALVVDENAFVPPIKKDRQQVAARMFRLQLLCIIIVNILCEAMVMDHATSILKTLYFCSEITSMKMLVAVVTVVTWKVTQKVPK